MSRKPSSKALRIAALPAIAVLSLGSWLIQFAVWGSGDLGTGRGPAADGLRHASNAIEMLHLPGRVLAAIVGQFAGFGLGSAGQVARSLPVHLLSWLIIAAGVVGAVCLWRRCVTVADLFLRGQRLRCADADAPDLARRGFLRAAAGTTAAGAVVGMTGGAGAAVHAVAIEPYQLRDTRYRVPIRGLPSWADGLRILQLTDTHLGPRVPTAHIESAVERAIALRPDVVALTGDYVQSGRHLIEPAVAVFQPIVEAGIPVVSVMGNHDWFEDCGPAMQKRLRETGLNPIDNARVYLTSDRRIERAPRADALCFAGFGDLDWDGCDAEAALGGVDPATPRVLLSHQPDAAELSLSGHRVDLMLCGHTHGGQVRLPMLGTPMVPSRYGSKYAYGLVDGPSCPVVVSSGVGVSMLPVRFGVPPEIVEITLDRVGDP